MDIETLWQKKEWKITIIVVGTILVAWLGMATWKNKVEITQKNIHQFWEILESSCAQRVQLLAKLNHFMVMAQPKENEILFQKTKAIVEKNQPKISILSLDQEVLIKQLMYNQSEIVAAFSLIDKYAITNPTLASNQAYFKFFKELDMLDAQITFALGPLNRQIGIYNRLIGGVPQKWVNVIYPRYAPKYLVHVPTLKNP